MEIIAWRTGGRPRWRGAMSCIRSVACRVPGCARRNCAALAEVHVEGAMRSQNAAHAGGEGRFGFHAVVGAKEQRPAWVKKPMHAL